MGRGLISSEALAVGLVPPSPQPECASPQHYAASRWRWWILLHYALLSILQSLSWNIFSPIEDVVKRAYGWEDWTFSWGANVANIGFALALVPMAAFYEKSGARSSTVVSAAALMVCCLVRLVPLTGTPFVSCVYVSMLSNGLSGAWLNFGGPLLSEIWFPVHERTLATTIACNSTYVGAALGFIIGPFIVGTPAGQAASRRAVKTLLWCETAVTSVVALCVFFKFPKEPQHPPSEAAAQRRQRAQVDDNVEPALPGLEALLGLASLGDCSARHVLGRFWLLNFCMSAPLGVYQSWGVVMSLNLTESGFNISTDDANWLGCWMTLCGCLGSVVVGALMDRLVGRMKTAILVLSLTSALGFLVFTIVLSGRLAAVGFDVSHSTAVLLLKLSGIVAGFGLNCSIPLYFELTLETVHGHISESGACTMLILSNTVIQLTFLAMPTNIGGSALWMNYVMFVASVASLLLMIPFRARYLRRQLDSGEDVAAGCDKWGCI